MNVAIQYTRYLNEGQGTAVGCSDQPLYAWKKKLQWAYPDGFSKEKYFVVMGGLHLEQHLHKINGQKWSRRYHGHCNPVLYWAENSIL